MRMNKFLQLLYWIITVLYTTTALYIIYNSNSIQNTNSFAVTIGGMSILSIGFTSVGYAFSFYLENQNNKQNKEINDKLDKIISFHTEKDEIINEAKQNQELYDLNIIDFYKYDKKRRELKEKFKKIDK